MERVLVPILAAIGLAVVGVLITFLVQELIEKRRRAAEADLSEQKINISHQGIRYDALRQFYSRARLHESGLGLYALSVDGEIVVSPTATKNEWLGLAIDASNVECRRQPKPLWVPPPAFDAVPRDYRNHLLAKLERSGAVLFDDPIYRLVELKIEQDRIAAEFSVDRFFNYRKVSGLVIEELEETLVRNKVGLANDLATLRSRLGSAMKQVPLRESLLPGGRELIDFANRMPQGGVCVMLAIARPSPDDDYMIPIMRRTGRTAIAQEDLTLTPQGMHAPRLNREHEVGLRESVLRELWEEVFGVEEAERGERGAIDAESHPPIRWLLDHPEQITFEFVSFVVNLHQGNYEFGVLLAVHDPAYFALFSEYEDPNWETTLFHRLSSKRPDEISQILRRKDWTPEARLVLAEGLTRLDSVQTSMATPRVLLPAIESSVV